MTCREAIFTLHTLFRLSGRRAEQQTANKAAKFLYCLLAVFVCGYMAWAGLKLAELVSAGHLGSYRFIFGLLPFLLFFDYVFRYASDSRRPVQVRPYLLLPLPKYACTDCLIIRQLLHVKNTFFLFLCIPFGIMTVVPERGVKAMAGYTLGLYLLLLANGQFFQFTQVLIAQRLRYWLLPAVVYLSAAATPFFFSSPQNYISLFARAGDALMAGNVCVYTVLLLLLAALTGLNRRVLYDWTRQEQYAAASANGEQSSLRLAFLERFDLMGEYFKLEVRSIFRNRRIRYLFISNTAFIAFYALGLFLGLELPAKESHAFLFYSFVIYGIAFLTRIMCIEGNYFECLLMQRDSIFTLLLAKYYFYSALLLLPLLLLLPAVLLGRVSLWTILAYALFTAGVCYRIFFQMAIYNKVTQPLNAAYTGKMQRTSYLLILIPFIVLFSPLPFVAIGSWWLNRSGLTDAALSFSGIIFIAAHRRWIASISRKMKKKQYDQIDGFRNSR